MVNYDYEFNGGIIKYILSYCILLLILYYGWYVIYVFLLYTLYCL
jgi:hypothetical protein